MTTPDQPDSPIRDLRSYGRRHGRKLSARQERLRRELLPKLAIDPAEAAPWHLAKLFGADKSDVWLEIGFGGGEHLIAQARANPDIGFIGCEPYIDGVVKVLAGIEDHGLKNIRLYDGDAREILRWLPEASIARAFILFPDPWPKRRHVKRRLVNPETLKLLARTMKPNSGLRIATDIGDYARTILIAMRNLNAFGWTARSPNDWRQRAVDWPPTRYEAKARAQGRRCYYFTFTRGSS